MRRRRPGRGDGRRAPRLTADLDVRLQPRSSRDQIAGERGGRLLVRVTAPPVDGAANEALCRLLAKRLGIARGRVRIVRGERSRDKTVRVEGMSEEAARAALEG